MPRFTLLRKLSHSKSLSEDPGKSTSEPVPPVPARAATVGVSQASSRSASSSTDTHGKQHSLPSATPTDGEDGPKNLSNVENVPPLVNPPHTDDKENDNETRDLRSSLAQPWESVNTAPQTSKTDEILQTAGSSVADSSMFFFHTI